MFLPSHLLDGNQELNDKKEIKDYKGIDVCRNNIAEDHENILVIGRTIESPCCRQNIPINLNKIQVDLPK